MILGAQLFYKDYEGYPIDAVPIISSQASIFIPLYFRTPYQVVQFFRDNASLILAPRVISADTVYICYSPTISTLTQQWSLLGPVQVIRNVSAVLPRYFVNPTVAVVSSRTSFVLLTINGSVGSPLPQSIVFSSRAGCSGDLTRVVFATPLMAVATNLSSSTQSHTATRTPSTVPPASSPALPAILSSSSVLKVAVRLPVGLTAFVCVSSAGGPREPAGVVVALPEGPISPDGAVVSPAGFFTDVIPPQYVPLVASSGGSQPAPFEFVPLPPDPVNATAVRSNVNVSDALSPSQHSRGASALGDGRGGGPVNDLNGTARGFFGTSSLLGQRTIEDHLDDHVTNAVTNDDLLSSSYGKGSLDGFDVAAAGLWHAQHVRHHKRSRHPRGLHRRDLQQLEEGTAWNRGRKAVTTATGVPVAGCQSDSVGTVYVVALPAAVRATASGLVDTDTRVDASVSSDSHCGIVRGVAVKSEDTAGGSAGIVTCSQMAGAAVVVRALVTSTAPVVFLCVGIAGAPPAPVAVLRRLGAGVAVTARVAEAVAFEGAAAEAHHGVSVGNADSATDDLDFPNGLTLIPDATGAVDLRLAVLVAAQMQQEHDERYARTSAATTDSLLMEQRGTTYRATDSSAVRIAPGVIRARTLITTYGLGRSYLAAVPVTNAAQLAMFPEPSMLTRVPVGCSC